MTVNGTEFNHKLQNGVLLGLIYKSLTNIVNFVSEPPKLLPLSFGADVMDEGGFAQVRWLTQKK